MFKFKVFSLAASFCCLLATITFLLAAGQVVKAAPSSEVKLIYIITPSGTNPFFRAEVTAATAKAKELGYEVCAAVHDESPAKQSELFAQAIENQAVAIICDNADPDSTIVDIKKARRANIPTFLIDREINANGIAVAQILSNNDQGARIIAQEFANAMGGTGEYIELMGNPSDNNAEIRSRNFHEVLDTYPSLTMVAQQTGYWEKGKANKLVKKMLKRHPNIRGIICGNDMMALGAIAALEKKGISGIVVTGMDGIDEAAEAIRDGSMAGTSLQPVVSIAEMAVEQVDKYLKDRMINAFETQFVDCVLITKENVDRLRAFNYNHTK